MGTEVLTAAISLVAGVLVLVVCLAVARPKGTLLAELLRLVTRLARDRTLPRGVRVRLWLLLAYLASPVDLIPDVIPVIGYADDAIIVAIVLRSVIRRAGAQAIARHWPGTPDGLAAIHRLPRTTEVHRGASRDRRPQGR